MSDPDAVRDAGAAPRRGRSVRTRVLPAMMAFMFAGLAIAGGVTHSLLFAQMTERVHADLAQEVDELRLLAAEGMDDGQPFTDVTSLLRRATASAVPGQHESVLALTDGEPRFRPQVDQHGASFRAWRFRTPCSQPRGREVARSRG
ncbi:hypothetical protein [Parenemella sanctibonifatiensis]|uniref:Uncharacterized protein n=1 Tax=Parenemella sanctibonifatiensis TaxID=2016505 RepID=A0A255DZ49_9ACTN|nr:hypothetical protein [Parenemella sanctibonifatiensis]OYN84564.1 hypothetical protein CGZ92_12030 [Parenemella sanctibonifatiensis]